MSIKLSFNIIVFDVCVDLDMITEQERTETKMRQAQGISIAKQKGIYKGEHTKFYTVFRLIQ